MKEENTDESYIGLICNGEFNAIHDFKIGELFESFFDNINYNVVREENSIYVDFTGEAICDDEPCTILIRFKIDDSGDEFEVNKVKVNEDILLKEFENILKAASALIAAAMSIVKFVGIIGKMKPAKS